jgi:hypothetical protein
MSLEKKNPFEQLLNSHLSASLSRPRAEPCPDENWMVAYLEGSQSDHFKKTFEQHLLRCDRCQSEMALLLEAPVTEAKPMPSTLAAEPNARTSLFADLFGWMRAAAFRPVFAILLVSVITGVVGYQLLRDDRILRERAVETAESRAPKSSDWADTDRQPAAPPLNDQESVEHKPSVTSSLVRRQGAQDRLETAREGQAQPRDLRNKVKSNSQDSEMKDGFAAEPPSSVPAEPNRHAKGAKLERRDVGISSRALPEQLQKESASASVVERQNSPLDTKADETAVNARKQPMRPAAPAGARAALGALSARKEEQDKPANAEEEIAADGAGKKKQGLGEAKGEAGAFATSEARAVSHIEVGGKQFDLSDGLWRDSSILPSDPLPTVVNVLSLDFERHRKQLALYQPVISRPEDVLIKLHSQVYRIQKTPN